ncbi:hypothetical protein [Streptomyces mexicanus]|uniref:hypothetical protein n=1 Tax=Streptomyces mexicanus TaxID=178566 RepID=UPI0036531F7E
MSLSPDAKAVVRAADALTTQVRRIADALTTPVVKYEVRTDDDATTPITCPLCPQPRALRAPAEATDHFRAQHPEQRLVGGPWPMLVPPDDQPPSDDDPTTGTDGSSCTCDYINEPWIKMDHAADCPARPAAPCAQHPDAPVIGGMCGGCTQYPAGMRPAPAADNPPLAACRRMETRTCPPTYNGPCGPRPCARFESDDPTPWEPPPADEDALRTDRRDSLLVLLSRARRGVLTPDEAAQLQQHVETELRAGDRAREKAGDLAEACKTERRRADQVEELLRVAHETSNRSEAERARADRIRAEAQRDRDQHAAVLAEVLRHFTEHGHPGAPCVRTGWIRTSTVDQWRSVVAPTVERPWWQQVAAARAELAEAQAAIERVRSARDGIAELASYADGGAADAFGVVLHRLTAALDGTEQPTTTKE